MQDLYTRIVYESPHIQAYTVVFAIRRTISINYRYVWVHSLLFCLLLISQPGIAQRFNGGTTKQAIPEFTEANPAYIDIPIQVAGLPNKLGKTFGLETVQLAITHSYISDVKVVLYSPDKTEIWITNRNGRNGGDYIETRFTQNGFKGLVSEGTAPFLGEYIPDGQLSYVNNGQNPNGLWQLRVYDLKPGDMGLFNSVSLFFGDKPAVGVVSNCSFSNPAGCRCADGTKNGWLLPDLMPNAQVTLNNMVEVAFTPKAGHGLLQFAFETMNVGYGPLEMRGSGRWSCSGKPVKDSQECPDGSMSRQDMEQVIYGLRNNMFVQQKQSVGSIAYDRRPGHEHFHFDDYVRYALLKKVEGEPDPAKWHIIGEGSKASFCIWDLGWCRNDLKNCADQRGKTYRSDQLPNYGLGAYRGCDAHLQGLAVGGTDLYGENYEGQSLELPKGLPNGNYWLWIVIDPANKLRESNKANNALLLPIQLTKQQG